MNFYPGGYLIDFETEDSCISMAKLNLITRRLHTLEERKSAFQKTDAFTTEGISKSRFNAYQAYDVWIKRYLQKIFRSSSLYDYTSELVKIYATIYAGGDAEKWWFKTQRIIEKYYRWHRGGLYFLSERYDSIDTEKAELRCSLQQIEINIQLYNESLNLPALASAWENIMAFREVADQIKKIIAAISHLQKRITDRFTRDLRLFYRTLVHFIFKNPEILLTNREADEDSNGLLPYRLAQPLLSFKRLPYELQAYYRAAG